MVVALMIFAFAGGIIGAGISLAAGLPLWAALVAYPATGSLCALLLAVFVVLRSDLLARSSAAQSRYVAAGSDG